MWIYLYFRKYFFLNRRGLPRNLLLKKTWLESKEIAKGYCVILTAFMTRAGATFVWYFLSIKGWENCENRDRLGTPPLNVSIWLSTRYLIFFYELYHYHYIGKVQSSHDALLVDKTCILNYRHVAYLLVVWITLYVQKFAYNNLCIHRIQIMKLTQYAYTNIPVCTFYC